MALEGDLKDFAITSILPIIKSENQTGVLEVKYKEEVCRVSFLEGQVVYGETIPARDLKRLRDTLLANRIMSRDDWSQLQAHQRDTLDSVWNVLYAMIPPEPVARLLQRQVRDSIFALLRFVKGGYRFIAQKKVEYPSHLIQPMDVDFLLMDGARVTDEWSVMEKKLPSFNTILRKAILSDQDPDDSTNINAEGNFGDFSKSLEYEVLQQRGIKINENEKGLLSIVFNYGSVRDLMDRADLSWFDAGSAIVSLLQKKILAPMTRKQFSAEMRPRAGKTPVAGFLALVLLTIAAGLAGYYCYVNFPGRFDAGKTLIGGNFTSDAQSGLKNVYYALKAFYGQTGGHAGSLDELVSKNILSQRCITDPWGRAFQYEKRDSYFVIYSLGPEQYVKGDEVFLDVE
ncbi:MAG: hypothetical protein IEMM0002_1170 [bacterium]|nr:MAG: hypothetical protein IEMM0002_1170 [bacterium]